VHDGGRIESDGTAAQPSHDLFSTRSRDKHVHTDRALTVTLLIETLITPRQCSHTVLKTNALQVAQLHVDWHGRLYTVVEVDMARTPQTKHAPSVDEKIKSKERLYSRDGRDPAPPPYGCREGIGSGSIQMLHDKSFYGLAEGQRGKRLKRLRSQHDDDGDRATCTTSGHGASSCCRYRS
jgi:hypothetical protein